MKHGPESQQHNPNLTAKSKRRLALLAAPLLLAAACSTTPKSVDATPQTKAPVTAIMPETTVTLPLSPEQKIAQENERLKIKTQATAEDFASRIIAEYNQHKSKHNFLYEPTDGSDSHAVTVLYNTKTLLAGAYGEYGLTATVHRNAEGQLDPSTVDSVMLFTNVNVAGKEVAKNPGDRENIYGFSLTKDRDTGDWSIHVDRANKGGIDKVQADTSRTTIDQYNTPITVEQFDSLVGQANTMFDWAVNQAAVNYIPEAAK